MLFVPAPICCMFNCVQYALLHAMPFSSIDAINAKEAQRSFFCPLHYTQQRCYPKWPLLQETWRLEEQLADMKDKAEDIHISMGNLHHRQHRRSDATDGQCMNSLCPWAGEVGVGKMHSRPNKQLKIHKLP